MEEKEDKSREHVLVSFGFSFMVFQDAIKPKKKKTKKINFLNQRRASSSYKIQNGISFSSTLIIF